jgi:hypothetical protein
MRMRTGIPRADFENGCAISHVKRSVLEDYGNLATSRIWLRQIRLRQVRLCGQLLSREYNAEIPGLGRHIGICSPVALYSNHSN